MLGFIFLAIRTGKMYSIPNDLTLRQKIKHRHRLRVNQPFEFFKVTKMSRKRPMPGPGQKRNILFYLKSGTSQEQPEQPDQIRPIETLEQQTEGKQTGQREMEREQLIQEQETHAVQVIEEHAEGQAEAGGLQIMEEDTEGQNEASTSPVQQGQRSRALDGAATYRAHFKNEWTTSWPFITRGSLNTHYWCAICRIENSCCHQGVTDVVRHIKSKGHQEKQRALQSTATISQFAMPVPSVGGMSPQEVKV